MIHQPSTRRVLPMLVLALLLTAGCLGDDDGEDKKEYDATIQFSFQNVADDDRTHKIRVSIIDLTRSGTDKDSCSQEKDYTVPPSTGSIEWTDVEVFMGDYTLNFYDYTADTVHERDINLTDGSPIRRVTLFIYSNYMVTTLG